MPDSISIAEARRIALASQLFASRTAAPRSVRAVDTIVRRLGVVQIDSVNVLVRSHYLPLYSRFGPYARELLERSAYGPRRVLFEYWGHEASLLPIEWYPLFRWRMQRAQSGEGVWGRLKRYASEHQALVNAVLTQLRDRGPLGAGDLAENSRGKGGWWGWSQSKEILEWLFWIGVVTTSQRRNFERLYDLTERVIPAEILSAPPIDSDEAQRRLMAVAARALGVATLRDLRDYFRLPTAHAAARLTELVDAGTVTPVSVEGWKQQAYLHVDARCPKSVEGCALLSPFDSLIWERQRTERLFDFHFRLEIYTPAHKRQHGYYVLPFLLGERVVGRVDLKSDRQRGCLQVRGGSAEENVAIGRIAGPLSKELQTLAEWLGLERVEVISRRGELMRALREKGKKGRANTRASRVAV